MSLTSLQTTSWHIFSFISTPRPLHSNITASEITIVMNLIFCQSIFRLKMVNHYKELISMSYEEGVIKNIGISFKTCLSVKILITISSNKSFGFRLRTYVVHTLLEHYDIVI